MSVSVRMYRHDSETSDIPLRKAVLYVIDSGIDEDACVVPSSRFDPNCCVNQATLREGLIGDGDRWCN